MFANPKFGAKKAPEFHSSFTGESTKRLFQFLTSKPIFKMIVITRPKRLLPLMCMIFPTMHRKI